MGMYTELVFSARLKRNLPKEVADLLQVIEDGSEWANVDNLKNLPDHPFFEAERWTMVFFGSSSYFVSASSPCGFADNVLTIRTSLKAYDNEIIKFMDFIRPYIYYGAGEKDLLGYSIYEESATPTLYYLKG